MIHPPDPDSRRNVRVAMKVSIMTDGPGGLHFTQAVQTGTYGTINSHYPEPFPNAQYLQMNDPQSRMLAWPAGSESSQQTQTENVLPIVETPVNTSKESDPYEPRGGPSTSPKLVVEGPETRPRSKHDHSHKHRHHHHHHRHRRSKSTGSERRPPSSTRSSSKPPSSIHTEDINYNYDQFFKLDSVRNLPFQFVDQLGPTVSLLDKLEFDKAIEDPLPEKSFYAGASSSSFDNLYQPKSLGSDSDEILINTFSDEMSENAAYSRSKTRESDVILEKEMNLKQSLVLKGPDKNVIHKFDNIDKSVSLIDQRGKGVTRVQEIETTNDLPLTCCTSGFNDEKKEPRPLPDIVAVLMEPIVKLTEQLALAKNLINEPYDLKANEESNFEIKTTLSAWKRDLSKKPELDDSHIENLGPNSAPLETLINDVGMESKEIQTSPQKFDSSTLTEQRTYIFDGPLQRDLPLETLIDDVGVESKEIQTLPEKFNAGTNTDGLPQEAAHQQLGSLIGASNETLESIPRKEPVKIPRISKPKSQSSIGVQAEEREDKVAQPSEKSDKYSEIVKNEPTVIITKLEAPGPQPKLAPGFIKSKSTVILKPTHPPPSPPPVDETVAPKKPQTNYGGFIEQPHEEVVPSIAPSTGGALFNRRPASSVEIFQLLTKDGPGKRYGMLGSDSDLYNEHIYETPSFPPLRRDLYTLLELPESPKSDDRTTVSHKDVKNMKKDNINSENLTFSSQSTSYTSEQYSDGYQSINSARSSISGILKKGDYKTAEIGSVIEENLLDYSQEEISPIGKMVELAESDDGGGTPNRNSLASETSLKADESYELYSESVSAAAEEMARAPTSSSVGPTASLERSFDEIMQMAAGNSRSNASHDQHIQLCYPKLYKLSRGLVETEAAPPSSFVTPEDDKDFSGLGPFSGKGTEPMIDNNSSSSTLTSMGDYVRRNSSIVRTAEIVDQTLTRPEMHEATTDTIRSVYVSSPDDLIGQIPPNLTVKPLLKKSFKQTSL